MAVLFPRDNSFASYFARAVEARDTRAGGRCFFV